MMINKILDNKEIQPLASGISIPYDLRNYAGKGYFSLQVSVSGAGTAKFEYMISNDEVNYVLQNETDDIILNDFTCNSGPESDGHDLVSFEPEPAKSLKIRYSEIGGLNVIYATATLLIT